MSDPANIALSNKASSLDVGKLLLRLAVGLMLFHGVAKLRTGVEPIAGMLAAKGLPQFLAYGTYVGEVIAPLLVVVGAFTRPAAAVVAFNMVMALGLAHMGDLARLDEHGAWVVELPVLYLLAALAVVFAGAGRLSVSRGKAPWN